jgi:hypothetical protein
MKDVNVRHEERVGRKAYEAPKIIDAGSFRRNTGYVGIKQRESLTGFPRVFW